MGKRQSKTEMVVKLMSKIEIHKDLENSIVELQSGYKMIHHPLYVGTYTGHEFLNEIINDSYKEKKELLQKFVNEENIHSLIYLIERPYRVESTMSALDSWWKPTKQEYWDFLSWLWVDTENVYENFETWVKLLFCKFEEPQLMMNDDEKEVYDNLPHIIKIYRGGVNDEGLSWTLNKDTAEWFAKRYNKNYKVFSKEISKKNVLAYIDTRKEEEIICF